jgi:UDP-N-acetyl-D-galactosamine dehydrogenase
MAIHQNQKKNQRIIKSTVCIVLLHCDIAECNYYIITVQLIKNNRPDLTPLYKSSETVGKVLKKRRHSNL